MCMTCPILNKTRWYIQCINGEECQLFRDNLLIVNLSWKTVVTANTMVKEYFVITSEHFVNTQCSFPRSRLIPDRKVYRSCSGWITGVAESSWLSARVTLASKHKSTTATQLRDKVTWRVMNKACRLLARGCWIRRHYYVRSRDGVSREEGSIYDVINILTVRKYFIFIS